MGGIVANDLYDTEECINRIDEIEGIDTSKDSEDGSISLTGTTLVFHVRRSLDLRLVCKPATQSLVRSSLSSHKGARKCPMIG